MNYILKQAIQEQKLLVPVKELSFLDGYCLLTAVTLNFIDIT